MMEGTPATSASFKDLIAFWIFGLANNYGYVVMLTAAEDIINNQEIELVGNKTFSEHATNKSDACEEKIVFRNCKMSSTGEILLANILPTLFVKMTFPFFMYWFPFGMRHLIVCLLQALSFIIVALSRSYALSLFGVVIGSLGVGLGEICYLSLTAHYSAATILAWSSGTGGAGVMGAGVYSILTEPLLFNLSSRVSLFLMLIVPFIFAITYWIFLTPMSSIYRLSLMKPSTWIVPKEVAHRRSTNDALDLNGGHISIVEEHASGRPFHEKLLLIVPLLKYMLPLGVVYYAEYLINQGIVQLIHFDCSHGFGISNSSQYRWNQVLYQVGVFFSRSSVKWIKLPLIILYMLPVLQCFNTIVFFLESMYLFIPHIILIFTFTLIEGLFGGAAYVNTFDRIHKEAPPEVKEFSLSVASMGDSIGVVAAGLSAIPLHNYICGRPLPARH